MLLAETDAAGMPELVTTLGQIAARSPAHRARITRELADAGHAAAAICMARDAFADPASNKYNLAEAARAWLSAVGPEAADDILTVLEQNPATSARTRVQVAQALAEAGATDRAVSMARDVLADPDTDSFYLGGAAEAWLSAAGPAAADEILATVEFRSPGDTYFRAKLASALAEHGNYEAAADQALRALKDPALDSYDIPYIVQALIEAEGISGAIKIRTALETRHTPLDVQVAAADAFAAAGAMSMACDSWTNVMLDSRHPIISRLHALSRLINTGHRHEAINALNTALQARDIPKPQRAYLRALMVWASLSDAGLSVCGPCAEPDVAQNTLLCIAYLAEKQRP